MAPHVTEEPSSQIPSLLSQLSLLHIPVEPTLDTVVRSTPIFTESVRAHDEDSYTQYGLLGGQVSKMNNTVLTSPLTPRQDPRVYFNVAAPSSVFICGSQGSGKSHTLSCLLENCLIASEANVLPHPLTGLVLHYDTFVSDEGGYPCEAACLSSSEEVSVRVLCPPTNLANLKRLYARHPRVTVEALQIDEKHLNTQRMLDLMAISSIQGSGMPLYLHVITRILRQMRKKQQYTEKSFNYAAFKAALSQEDLTPGQWVPLQQRMDTLESFMVETQTSTGRKTTTNSLNKGNSWAPQPGELTIVDLSCPCVTPDAACALFNICVSLFIEQDPTIGRVIALDEAHKYMTHSEDGASSTLTETLLSIIRLQRHVATRVIVSTQEPTVSPKLLDLSSVTIVHRFTSPAWLRSLKQHLATDGASDGADDSTPDDSSSAASLVDVRQSDFESKLLGKILALGQGEAFLFSPSSIIDVSEDAAHGNDVRPIKLGSGAIKIHIRKRVTEDGGRTIMAE
ncbi:hypothetical protein CDD80_3773 [Ophiocordyceps camponoti-rufipedis]|uniref:Zona occludens toxin N-terminal domain-containing protein n=1 Tax=Ophiocordyceps camponoti-rufipedis TaxID=2004952 RepID=A0A2C5ZIY8_9HYPO|nr:hypothetical protein CDD80_3773 [Ophiocordyceps camponoti-rufipedis]